MLSAAASATSAAVLDVPGARLHYEVRGTGPLVLLVGSPMDATAFEPLADLLATDHTVLTTDPRGINRSPLEDPAQDSTPQLRAGDLAALLTDLDAGPAVAFGSSGGAVSVLALAQSHPDLVHAVIVHEAPVDEWLPDRDKIRAETEDIIATYATGDRAAAWRMFMEQANIHLPDDVFEMMFGTPLGGQAAVDEAYFFAHEVRETCRWQPDIAALSAASTRIVIGIGSDSGGELCERTSESLAEALGLSPMRFPGGHLGFLDDPDHFAVALRAVLSEG